MYILFVGTTDFYYELKEYLSNLPHTLLEGTSKWEDNTLNAQVIIFFSLGDAKKVKAFCETTLKQKSCPLFSVTSEEV